MASNGVRSAVTSRQGEPLVQTPGPELLSAQRTQPPAQSPRNEDRNEVVHRYCGPAKELFTHAGFDHLVRDAPESLGQLGAQAADLEVFSDQSQAFVHGAHFGGHGSHGP